MVVKEKGESFFLQNNDQKGNRMVRLATIIHSARICLILNVTSAAKCLLLSSPLSHPTVHLSAASFRSGRSGISSRLLGSRTSPFLPRDSDSCLLFSAASASTLRSTDLFVAVCNRCISRQKVRCDENNRLSHPCYSRLGEIDRPDRPDRPFRSSSP